LVVKNLFDVECEGLVSYVGVVLGDVIFFVVGFIKSLCVLLGVVWFEIGCCCGFIDELVWLLLWVVDVLLFELVFDVVVSGDVVVGLGVWIVVYYVFILLKVEFFDIFDIDFGLVFVYVYDLVCNGNEIGGGLICIYCCDV